MLSHLRRPTVERPGLRHVLADLGPTYVANGLIGVHLLRDRPGRHHLSVGTSGGLSAAELASWVFGVFFFNGLITIAAQLVVQDAAGLCLDHPGNGAGRTGAATPEFCQK